MSILTVGPGQEYSTLAAAIGASQDGDTINVQAGTYVNDFAEIHDNITIQGVGGMVNLVATEAIPNGKAILITDGNDTINDVSFSGATVADDNGAGIRYQSGNLVLNDDDFHDNQEGLLAGSDPQGSITINSSQFTHNGAGDGQSHNLYVNEVATLTIDNSLFTDAVVGHEIKSRADTTIIENSRIIDGPTGTASYSIDLPDGGNAVIKNDVIEQGPLSQNETIIHYGGEGGPYANSALEITDNTVLNDLPAAGAVLLTNQTDVTASITDNAIYGLDSSQIASGPATQSGNTTLTTEPALDLTPPWQSATGTQPSSGSPPASSGGQPSSGGGQPASGGQSSAGGSASGTGTGSGHVTGGGGQSGSHVFPGPFHDPHAGSLAHGVPDHFLGDHAFAAALPEIALHDVMPTHVIADWFGMH